MVPTKRFAMAFAPCAHRRLEDLDVDSVEHGVEGGGELAVAVADEESEVPVGVVEVHDQVAGLLGEPGCGRVGGDAEDVDAAGGVFDDEECESRCRVIVSRWNRSQARMPWAWAWRNCVQVGPARRGAGSLPATLRMVHTVEAPMT